MPDLTKRESAYFIGTAIIALTILFGSLFLWDKTQHDCWSKYDDEQTAIRMCEL
jgi:hypothetical protein